MRTKVLITGFLSLVLLGVVWVAFERGYPGAVRAGGPPTVRLRATCGPVPDTIGDWRRVQWYLAWSGCMDNECWSVWVNQTPNALMEYRPYRCENLARGQSESGCPATPASVPPGIIIYDPRAECNGELAAGAWYHNAFARPVWKGNLNDQPDPISVCTWEMDLSRLYWNFAEEDECQVCVAPTSVPVSPGVPTNTPVPTVCEERPFPPTRVPPSPTPFLPNPPSFTPKAFTHSRYDSYHGVYTALSSFYWPWQEFLHASLSAEVHEPSQPNCTSSTEVLAYWLEGSRWHYQGQEVVQMVCPINGGEDQNCRWRPVYEGSQGRWVDPDISQPEWIHLIWTYEGVGVSRPATWEFAPVGPTWVEIHYHILATTTYACETFTFTAPWTDKLVLRVGLLRSVLTGGRR